MMTPLDLTFAIVGGIIALATFYIGRQTAAKGSGQQWGEFTTEIKSDLKYIKEDVKEIKTDMKAVDERYSAMREDVVVMKRDLKTAFNKIDDLKK